MFQVLTDPALLFALGVIAAVLYLPRTGSRPRLARSVRKTLPVALFCLAAWADGAPALLVAALGVSAAGDWALSRPGERAFLVGMVSFALAHLAYIALMLGAGAGGPGALWPLAGAVLALGASTEVWLAPHTGALRWPVRVYVVIIVGMGLAALGLPEGYALATAGALLFMLSDLILSVETFRMGAGHPARRWAGKLVWITYIAAQTGLLLGLGPLA